MSATRASQNGAAPGDETRADDSAAGAESATKTSADAPWADAIARWQELREYGAFYISANLDRLRLTSRVTFFWAVIGALAAVVVTGIVLTASALFVVSLAGAVGELLGGRTWLGGLVVSSTILLVAIGGTWFVLSRQVRLFQKTLVQKYENRKQQERKHYGTDVAQRAQERSGNG